MRAPRPGFTIVELLVVIVVIGILAAISIIAYNGINTKAAEASLQSDLTNASKQLSILQVRTGSYPQGNTPPSDLQSSRGNTLQYTSTDGSDYCLTATSSNSSAKAYYISSTTGTVAEGSCSGHPAGGSGGSGGSEIAANTPIQNITQTQCQALPVYTGTNDTQAVKTVTDNRGGTTRTYRIAKLADNNCWTLDNLKLGSTTSTTTLTPGDTNITSNFTLPQLTTGGSADNVNPRAYGPIPGDTGSGATNYGYLYNWSAATAGESSTSHPAGAGNAPYSICPSGWRLPTGGNTGEFAMLNAKMNNPAATSPSTSVGTGYYQNWQYTGLFKGVFPGRWWGGFGGQGSYGGLWSSSAYPDWSGYALHAEFDAGGVGPDIYNSRGLGNGVRCLLN